MEDFHKNVGKVSLFWHHFDTIAELFNNHFIRFFLSLRKICPIFCKNTTQVTPLYFFSIETSTGLVLFPKIAQSLGLCLAENKVKPGLLAEGTTGQIANEISSLLMDNGIKSFEAREITNNSLTNSYDKILSTDLVKELADTVALFTRLKQHGTKIAVCTADNR